MHRKFAPTCAKICTRAQIFYSRDQKIRGALVLYCRSFHRHERAQLILLARTGMDPNHNAQDFMDINGMMFPHRSRDKIDFVCVCVNRGGLGIYRSLGGQQGNKNSPYIKRIEQI
jgi:hypothetical protein